MKETAQECGNFRHRNSFQMAVAVGYNGSDRQRSWEEVRMVVLSTLQSGESVLFHCRAGVHRGPMLAAAVALAWVTRIAFDDALYITSSRFAPLSLTKFALGPVVIRFLTGPGGRPIVICLAFPFLGIGLGGHPADPVAFGMLFLQMVILDLCASGVSRMPRMSSRDRQSLATLPWRRWGMIVRSVGSALCCALALNGSSCIHRFGGEISASL